jgi:hypothetical protein
MADNSINNPEMKNCPVCHSKDVGLEIVMPDGVERYPGLKYQANAKCYSCGHSLHPAGHTEEIARTAGIDSWNRFRLKA